MTFHLHVVVQADADLLPLREYVGMRRQAGQRGPIELLIQLRARAGQFPERSPIQLVDQFPNRFVQLPHTEELTLPQCGHHPTLRQQNPLLDLGFIPRMSGARRDNGHTIVSGPILVGAIQLRFPIAGPAHAGTPLIGHHQFRGALEELESPGMGRDPVGQVPCPGGFGVGVVAGAQHRHEDGGRPGFAGNRVDDLDGVAGVVDEHLLAGTVILPQHHIQVTRPVPILLAKPTVTDPVGLIFLVFLPEQLQGHAAIGLQLLMYFGEVRFRPGPRRCGHWRKQQLFQLGIVQILR